MAVVFCRRTLPLRQKWQTVILGLRSTPWSARNSTEAKGLDDIAAMLDQPSWSVKSFLEPTNDLRQESITQKQLHHLLRISALPLPKSESEEAAMIKDLQTQLRFVQAIQKVNTEGVKPLQSIRDETERAELENMITVQSLQDEFDKEVVVGRRGRITKAETLPNDPEKAENWDPLGQASKKIGRYFVVETDKD
jgi:Asp-tRNA(Asn)/Glu-tRNA(Gln) amidotransferase C subunit